MLKYIFYIHKKRARICHICCNKTSGLYTLKLGLAKYLWPQLKLNVCSGPPKSGQHILMSHAVDRTNIIKTAEGECRWLMKKQILVSLLN